VHPEMSSESLSFIFMLRSKKRDKRWSSRPPPVPIAAVSNGCTRTRIDALYGGEPCSVQRIALVQCSLHHSQCPVLKHHHVPLGEIQHVVHMHSCVLGIRTIHVLSTQLRSSLDVGVTSYHTVRGIMCDNLSLQSPPRDPGPLRGLRATPTLVTSRGCRPLGRRSSHVM